MNINEDRIQFISNARVLGILLVVFGHSFPFNVELPSVLYRIQLFIYRFHMPLFVCISGYLVTFNRYSLKEYTSRRMRRLLIPYFSLSLIAFLPKLLIQNLLNDSVELSLAYLLRSEFVPRDNVWGHFWYLPVILFLSISGKYILEISKNRTVLLLFAFLISFILLFSPETTDWFALEDIRTTAFYFMTGIVMANFPLCTAIFQKYTWGFALPASIVMFLFCNTTLSFILTACIMIGFIFHLSVQIHNMSRLVRFLDTRSYTIFLLSWPVQAVTEVVFNRLLHFPPLITMLFMFVSGLIVPIMIYQFLKWLDNRVQIRRIKILVGM